MRRCFSLRWQKHFACSGILSAIGRNCNAPASSRWRTSLTYMIAGAFTRSARLNRLLDPAAAQDSITVIENHGLAGSDRALRLVKVHAGAAFGQRRHDGG